ncbi:Nonribosomal peptide synthetase [Trichinella pseudospiralis]
MDITSDTTSDQTSSTNDSSRNMTSPKSRIGTYDAKGSALKYWMDRLQGVCAGPTDIEDIREATKTLGCTTQLFFESR